VTFMGRKELALNNCRATPKTTAHVHLTANMCPPWLKCGLLCKSLSHLNSISRSNTFMAECAG